MAYIGAFVWDGSAFVLCLVMSVYMRGLYRHFKASWLEKSYTYYTASAGVFCVAFAIRLGLDLFSISPDTFGASVSDPAIVLALALMLLGLRDTARFWGVSKAKAQNPG